MPKLIFFANTDWYLYNFRRSLALAAQSSGYEVPIVGIKDAIDAL